MPYQQSSHAQNQALEQDLDERLHDPSQQVAALIQSVQDLRDDMRQIAAAPAPAALPPSQAHMAERQRPWHNLPQRSYSHFVGRQAELEKLTQLLLPRPRSRHFVVTLDGRGRTFRGNCLGLGQAYAADCERHSAAPADLHQPGRSVS